MTLLYSFLNKNFLYIILSNFKLFYKYVAETSGRRRGCVSSTTAQSMAWHFCHTLALNEITQDLDLILYIIIMLLQRRLLIKLKFK